MAVAKKISHSAAAIIFPATESMQKPQMRLKNGNARFQQVLPPIKICQRPIFIRILMGSGICELESWEKTQILIGHQLGHKYWVGADSWQGG